MSGRPKTCTTCHRHIEPGDWYWVEQRWRETSHVSRTGLVRRSEEPTHHFYCDDHEPLTGATPDVVRPL